MIPKSGIHSVLVSNATAAAEQMRDRRSVRQGREEREGREKSRRWVMPTEAKNKMEPAFPYAQNSIFYCLLHRKKKLHFCWMKICTLVPEELSSHQKDRNHQNLFFFFFFVCAYGKWAVGRVVLMGCWVGELVDGCGGKNDGSAQKEGGGDPTTTAQKNILFFFGGWLF